MFLEIYTQEIKADNKFERTNGEIHCTKCKGKMIDYIIISKEVLKIICNITNCSWKTFSNNPYSYFLFFLHPYLMQMAQIINWHNLASILRLSLTFEYDISACALLTHICQINCLKFCNCIRPFLYEHIWDWIICKGRGLFGLECWQLKS